MQKHAFLHAVLGAGLIAAVAAPAQAGECRAPEMPVMPDGATASMQEMLDGQQAVKAFQGANMAYMKCLEEQFDEAKLKGMESRDAATRALAQAAYGEYVDAYNAAVSAEETLAGEFNIELREYKAANQ